MMQKTIEDLEKSYLNSMFIISHSPDTVKSYKSGIRRLREFLRDSYQIDEEKLLELIKSKQIEIYSFLKEMVVYLGQTIPHCHIHLIPRRKGDVDNPVGGIRNIISGKGNYLEN